MADEKYCVDCKHFIANIDGPPQCAAKPGVRCQITGQPAIFPTCKQRRSFGNFCYGGKLWEPRAVLKAAGQ